MPRDEILEYLINQSKELGIAPVREACNKFLRLGLKVAVELDTKRRIPIKWTQDKWRKQNGKCARCKSDVPYDQATGDHITPHSMGGRTELGNTRMVCKSCNSQKGDNDLITESRKSGQTVADIFGE